MNKELGEKYSNSAAEKMSYNLETLDSELFKYSTAAGGLLIWLGDKLLQTKTIFLIAVLLWLVLIVSKIISYKVTAVSQENYINFIRSEDKNVTERLKFFNIYKKTDALAGCLNTVSLMSFVSICLCVLYILFKIYYY